MKTWVRKTLSVGVLAAGALLFAPGAAHADTWQNTADNHGALNGTQAVIPINVPVNIVGNALGVAGEANAAGAGVNHVQENGRFDQGGRGGKGVRQNSFGNHGVANGTQAYVPINVPVNVVGNAAGVLFGEGNAQGVGVNNINGKGRKAESAQAKGNDWPAQQNSFANHGLLNGTQLYAPIDIPINVCGNDLALLGEANSQALCVNDVHGRRTEGAKAGKGVQQNSFANHGLANGTQIYAPVQVPINLAGNSAAVLGESNAAGVAHNQTESTPSGITQNSVGNHGSLNATQLAVPINIPINVCGNALGVLGEAHAAASCANGIGGGHGHGHGHQGGHGHGNGGDNGAHHGNGGNNGAHHGNGGVNGHNDDDDPQYLGDNGNQGNPADDDDDAETPVVSGGGDTDGYGKGREATTEATTESSPVDGLTKGLSKSNGAGAGGLDLLNTLR